LGKEIIQVDDRIFFINIILAQPAQKHIPKNGEKMGILARIEDLF
jgi:hypothetical protein